MGVYMVPSIDEHCRISELRTGKQYEDLHRWVDEYQRQLGVEHRQERHSLNHIEEVRKNWGEEGVLEYLIHIIADYRDTTNKLVKIMEEMKVEKLILITEKKELITEYNELLEEAKTLEHAVLVETLYYLPTKFKKK